MPLPPTSQAALAGATVLANLSASNATIGKAEYRRLLCTSQSAKYLAAYLYAAAGYGESTTDLAWDGHGLVCENGEILEESRRFGHEDGLIIADVDLEHLRQERMRMTSFSDCVQLNREVLNRFRRIRFDLELPRGPLPGGVQHSGPGAVNASVPKALIRHLIRWVVASGQFLEPVPRILTDVLASPITPELIPQADDTQ